MPRPMQHTRQAPRGTACNVACGTPLPPDTSRKHAPVTVGAQAHLGPGREATERSWGMGQSPCSLWAGQRRHGNAPKGFGSSMAGRGSALQPEASKGNTGRSSPAGQRLGLGWRLGPWAIR